MKKTITLWLVVILLMVQSACLPSSLGTSTGGLEIANSNPVVVQAAVDTSAEAAGNGSAVNLPVEIPQLHDDIQDYTWEEATVVSITLSGDSIQVDGAGVNVTGSVAVIKTAGTYRLSGALADGQIIIDTEDEEIVRLILNGVDLRSSTNAPLYIAKAKEVLLILAEGTENSIADGSTYIFPNPEDDEPNAALFSKSDLTISGSGALTVSGNYNDGIASKDGLVIAGGSITVNAVDDGVRGKDYLVIKSGHLAVNAQGDGLKADNQDDADLGFILIESGQIEITSGGDAVQAATHLFIKDGTFTISSGGGAQKRIAESESAKGLKAAANIVIDGGDFTIDSADDAINTNGNLKIHAGVFRIASGDDGMHADSTLEINGGEIRITQSYEGIESAVITINGGDIQITASDDGLNVAGGVDGSGMFPGMRPGGRPGGGLGAGQDAFNYTGNYYLYIHGGVLQIESIGDGIDVNGAIEMTGGVVIVNGPTVQMEGAIDYDASFKMNGGFLVAAGSSGMAQAPSQNSSQPGLLIYFNSVLPAGSLVHIRDSAGKAILTFAPSKAFQSIAFSSPELMSGATYQVYVGGSATGSASAGLYLDGSYLPGNLYTSFMIASTITTIGSGGGFGGRPPRP